MTNDDSNTTGVNNQFDPDEYTERLRKQNAELADSLHQMATFQDQLRTLRACKSVDNALDTMELLLEDILEVVYLRLYFFKDEPDNEMTLVREICPEEQTLDWNLVEWAMDNNELSLIPATDSNIQNEDIKNMLILPLIGHTEKVGALVIWVNVDADSFTQERSMLLSMLGRETASVLESLKLHHKLNAAHSELADIVENIPMGVMAIDKHNRLKLVNGTAEYIFSLDRNKSSKQKLIDILSQDIYNQIKPALTDNNSDFGEGELSVSLGGDEDEVFGITVGSLHIDEATNEESAKECGRVIVCRDLKLSREVAKLRELDAMKNDFLSLVSHELRTPLTSIMAYSETLLMEGMVDTEEERKEYLEIIYSEGERLSRLINDVLDLTKMESGKMDYIYTEVDLKDLVKTSIATVSSLAKPKNISMLTSLAESLPEIKADRDKIIQVLTNFYSNAIKFTDEGGSVTTEVKLLTDENLDHQEVIEVSVKDTGMGIPASEIHKVFSKFEQVEKIDHHSVGTGLGMPICKLIIEEGHAGRIWIESEEGVGTTIFFRIPVK